MYFPYFYGRAMELDAVAGSSSDFGMPQLVVPIIEPAFARDGVLARYVARFTRTLMTLQASSAAAYIVVNPHQGAFADLATVGHWAAGTSTLLADPALVRPTFKVRAGTTMSSLTSFLTTYQGRELGLVIGDEGALSAPQMAAAAGSENVRVFVFPEVDSGALVTAFGAQRVVRVRNNFTAKARNADYSGAEFFADNHLTHPDGFSDFTVLPSVVSFSGGRTGAAVVHLTYKVGTGAFWVEHFVSDEKDITRGSFQSKLLESLAHTSSAMAAHPARFDTSPSVVNYLTQHTTGKATSQGKNKQLLIEHHLYVVARHLGI